MREASFPTVHGSGWTGDTPHKRIESHRFMLQDVSYCILIALLAVGATLVPVQVNAQTPATTLKDSNGEVVLQSFVDGGLLVPGAFGAGAIPMEGAGTRLMWDPGRAAVRVGGVGVDSGTETYWDEENVGNYSVAMGSDPKASGFAAVALGERTSASGGNATALGAATTASGLEATALGRGTVAGGRGATATGFQTVAATDFSFVGGRCNEANQSADSTLFVVGNGAADVAGCTSRSDALVLEADGQLTAAGRIASQEGGFVLPDGTVLDGIDDTLPTNGNGAINFASDDGVVAPGAFGSGEIPTEGAGTRMMWYPEKAAFRAGRVGVDSGAEVNWNEENVGAYSVAVGRDTRAPGTAAVAMGDGTLAARDYSMSVGQYNAANIFEESSVLFVVGNGTGPSSTDRSDAFGVDEAGNAVASAHTTFSDRRLKTNIESMGRGTLERLLRLRPVRYTFRNQRTHPSGEQLGLVAQDVQAEFPGLVKRGSGGLLSLAYPKLTAVLVKGLQEQQATIDSLSEQVRRIETLEQRLASLESSRSSSLFAGGARSSDVLLLTFLLGLALGAGLLHLRRA